MKLGLLYELIRKDEKSLIEAARKKNVDFGLINDRNIVFKLEKDGFGFDLVLERCVHHARSLYSLKIFNGFGIDTINSSETAEICGNKFLVTELLIKNKVPTPRVGIAFTKESALKAVEEIGLPCVFKPAIGAWGLLCAKANDMDAVDAIISHKEKLGSYHNSVFYIQEYINKPGRDITAFVVGNEVVDAVYRTGKHWINHSEYGAELSKCKITPELMELALKAAKSVHGDIVAIDIIE